MVRASANLILREHLVHILWMQQHTYKDFGGFLYQGAVKKIIHRVCEESYASVHEELLEFPIDDVSQVSLHILLESVRLYK